MLLTLLFTLIHPFMVNGADNSNPTNSCNGCKVTTIKPDLWTQFLLSSTNNGIYNSVSSELNNKNPYAFGPIVDTLNKIAYRPDELKIDGDEILSFNEKNGLAVEYIDRTTGTVKYGKLHIPQN